MTTVESEKKTQPFWRRHLGALIVGGLVVLLLVNVGGQILEELETSPSGSPIYRSNGPMS